MMHHGQDNKRLRARHILLQGGSVMLLLCLVTAALSIPFVYPSTTMWYKTGLDRFLLYGGQLCGILAGLLLFFQIILIGAPAPFSRKTVVKIHRVSGLLIVLLALSHPFLVLASDGFTPLQLQSKYWPEFVGAALLSLVLLHTVISLWRSRLKIPYQSWRTIHRIGAAGAATLLSIHVLFVSDSFSKGLPRFSVMSILAVVLLIWLLLATGMLPSKRRNPTQSHLQSSKNKRSQDNET